MTNLSEEEYIKDAKRKVIQFEKGVRDGSIIVGEQIRKLVEYADPALMSDEFELRPEKIRRVFRFFSLLNIKRGNKYCQFILEPFQAYLLANVFGIYHKGTDQRRYLESALIMGRKNGKTSFMAAVALYMFLYDKQVNPNVAILSTVLGREKVLGDMKKIILQSDEISPYLLWSHYNIYINNNQKVDGGRELKILKDIGWCKILPNNFEKLDSLEICAAIFDEIHTYEDWTSYLTVKKGRGANQNSLMLIISTAGYIADGFCSQYIDYCKKVLSGEIIDKSIFPMLFLLDPEDFDLEKNPEGIGNRKLWYKTNPGLGAIKILSNMEDDYLKALHNPPAQADFETKDLNIFHNSADEMKLTPESIALVCKPFDESILLGLPCWIGVDLSYKRDMSAIICLFRDEIQNHFYVKPYFFIVDTIKRKFGPKMDQWIKDGHIFECKGGKYDFSMIADKLTEAVNTFNVKSIGYDSYKWTDIEEKLDWNKIRIPKSCFFPVYQGTKTMGEPLTYMLNKFYGQEITLGSNPVMKWTMLNAVIKVGDLNGNPKIHKDKSKNPDDGATALNDAFVAYQKSKKPKPVYGYKLD